MKTYPTLHGSSKQTSRGQVPESPREASSEPLGHLNLTDWDWEELVEREVLIDLAEWAQAQGCEPLARYRCAFTSELWTLLESIPFSAGETTSMSRRVRTVHCCAIRALERALFAVPADQFISRIGLEFGVPVATRSSRGSTPILRLHESVAFQLPLAMVVGMSCAAAQ